MSSLLDEAARSAKNNLRQSLMVTHNLTLHSTAPGDFIMNRMNNVLRAVIDANFGAASLEKVGELYAAIGEAQALMMDSSHGLALIHLSRSFAVVLEEAVRERQQRAGEGGNSNNNNPAPPPGWGLNAGKDIWQVPASGGGVAAPPGAYGRPPAPVRPLMSVAVSGPQQKGFGASSVANGGEAAARAARVKKEQEKDFSAEAKMGRVTVYKIPTSVGDKELRAHFSAVGGPLLEYAYPRGPGGTAKGFALLKFADNGKANAVVARLHGSTLDGAELSVERARYWFKRETAPDFRTRSVSVASAAAAPQQSAPSTNTYFNGSNVETFNVDKTNSDNSDEDSSDDDTDPGVC